MNIGILTHPQRVNYGGILQCYALSSVLRKLGHTPVVIRRENDRSFFLWEWIRSVLKFLHFPRYYNLNKIDKGVNIRPFIDKYLVRTYPVRSQAQMKKICNFYKLDAVIVGSDQVWRTNFATQFGYNYFLDFVPAGVRKFSYASSFGLSSWEYSSEQNKVIKKLLSEFSGVSVREADAISLLKEVLDISAVQHVDPTLLLDAEDYCKILNPKIIQEPYVFVYWLGEKRLIEDRLKEIEISGLKVISLFLRDNNEQISIEDWLSYIKYAKFIITDSFHGCVFSIIFEKQFEVLKNDSGGNGRIISLCEMLGISVNTKIDYIQVKQRLDNIRLKSIQYIEDNLQG